MRKPRRLKNVSSKARGARTNKKNKGREGHISRLHSRHVCLISTPYLKKLLQLDMKVIGIAEKLEN
jgi:hypothetical protein